MKIRILLLTTLFALGGCKPTAQTNPTASTPTASPISVGHTWYVNGQGKDENDGASEATAFRSLAKAAQIVNPGDTVLIGNGIYSDADRVGGTVAYLTRPGKPDAWITWKAAPGQKPVIEPHGWNGIEIATSYQIVEGLSVIGNNDSIIYKDAIEDATKATPNPYFNTNGITINGRKNAPDAKPHHVIIRHCSVSMCSGGGITGLETDYLTIEDNLIFNNAWFMRYGGSGITLLGNWAHDDLPGYHIVIQRNLVWNNRTNVQWSKIGKLSDGNGILLDVTDQDGEGATNPNADAVVKPRTASATPAPVITATPASPTPLPKPPRPEWKGRALIANNVSAYNGGSGIHTFRTKHVDIINNTTYSNGHNVGYPELFSNRSEDVVILNNIIVPRPGGKVTGNSKNKNNRWDYNIYPVAQNLASRPEDIVTGPNDLVADPKFVKIGEDLRAADFHLQKDSPSLDSGSNDIPQDVDLTGKSRPAGKGRDRGAYEQ